MVKTSPDTSRDLILLTLVYWVFTNGQAKTEFEAALALVFEDFRGAVGVWTEVDDFRKHYVKVRRPLTTRLSGLPNPTDRSR